MSRVYFHSPSGTAELRGSERAWLRSVAAGPFVVAWGLHGPGGFDRAVEIMAMVPEVPDGLYGANYLYTYLHEALQQDIRNRAVCAARKPGTLSAGDTDQQPLDQLVSALQVSLRVDGVTLVVAGVRLHSLNVDLNTALVAGSGPVRLAAKIHGWCECHAWVDGPDRA